MKNRLRAGLVVLAALACAACASGPKAPRPEDAPEYQRPPGNPFEESFAREDGVKPIRWGGWMKVLTEGTGATPDLEDKVKVNYRGTLTDGTEFDSSYKRGQPAVFPVTGVIQCWTNGLLMMKVGEKAKFVCPSAVAYGDAGAPPKIPGGATLVFEIELLDVVGRPQ